MSRSKYVISTNLWGLLPGHGRIEIRKQTPASRTEGEFFVVFREKGKELLTLNAGVTQGGVNFKKTLIQTGLSRCIQTIDYCRQREARYNFLRLNQPAT